MLNLGTVRAFVAVVETASFRKAAERLGTAQPTVSQQVRKLEEELGSVLVQRGHKACRPTRAGETFLPHARALIRAARRAAQIVQERPVRIGASGNVGTYMLPAAVRAFTDRTGVSDAVDIALAPNPETALRLENGEIDVAVMEWWDGRPGFVASMWRREPMRVIVPPDHPWAAVSAVPREWLLQAPLIGGEPGTGTGRLLSGLLGDQARRIDMRYRLESTEAVKMAVRHGLGVSLVLASAVASESQAGHLVALPFDQTDLAKDIYCITPEDLPASSGARRFRDLLLEHRNNAGPPT
jgi:DNA-binding transcriptional LysR family regulator